MIVGLIVIVIITIFLFIWLFWGAGNIDCPPDKILILYNNSKPKDQYEVITGGSIFVWPRRQHYDFLPLRHSEVQRELKVKAKNGEQITFLFDFVFQMSKRPDYAEKCVQHLLGLSDEEIKGKVSESIDTIFNKDFTQATVEEIKSIKFHHNIVAIKKSIEEVLKEIGIEVTQNAVRQVELTSVNQKSASEKLDPATEKKLEKSREILRKKAFMTRFPACEDVFLGNLEEYKKYLFPMLTLDLGAINDDWSGRKVHLLDFEEDPYYSIRSKYFNKYCRDAMIGFYIKENKFEFMTDMRFFEVSEEWTEYLEETKVAYYAEKESFERRPNDRNFDFQLGGEPGWWQSDYTPLDPDGNPMTFITEMDLLTRKQFLFYSHKHQIAVQLYQIT